MLSHIIFATIVLNPGITIGKLGKRFGRSHSWATGKLIVMENETSLRVCEGDKEHLFPYSRNGRPSAWLIQAIGR